MCGLTVIDLSVSMDGLSGLPMERSCTTSEDPDAVLSGSSTSTSYYVLAPTCSSLGCCCCCLLEHLEVSASDASLGRPCQDLVRHLVLPSERCVIESSIRHSMSFPRKVRETTSSPSIPCKILESIVSKRRCPPGKIVLHCCIVLTNRNLPVH